MSEPAERVVFDCNIYVQALINPEGPSGLCLAAAFARKAQLFVSPFVLEEIRKSPTKPTPARLGVAPEKAARLIDNLLLVATLIPNVPQLFVHPIDPDDSHYVNLALVTRSKLIVSRDRHLLGLNDPAKPWAVPFRQRFPELKVISSEAFLQLLREKEKPNKPQP